MTDEMLDRRLNAVRPDLADERLRGQVKAPRYTAGVRHQLVRPIAPLKSHPQPNAPIDNEVLMGERLRVFDTADGWAWVQLERDGYVGYVPADALSRTIVEPTHRVAALATFVYPEPNIKAPPLMHLSLGSELTVDQQDERFARLKSGFFVIGRHLSPLNKPAHDFVEVAERFIGVPYLWAGRSRVGLDCSGLVQLSLEASGVKAPRDSDMQQTLGSAVSIREDLEGLERGDLVCWRGHIGIMVDSILMIHANAHHMAVVVEPLASAAERSKRTGEPIRTVRRLTAPNA